MLAQRNKLLLYTSTFLKFNTKIVSNIAILTLSKLLIKRKKKKSVKN